MTTRNRMALGLTISVLSLLSPGFVGGPLGQEMAPEQRQERCQNNVNRLAELERQIEPIDDMVEDIDSEIRDIVFAQRRLSAIQASRDIPMSDFSPSPTQSRYLDSSILETWNRCMAAETLFLTNTDDAKRSCISALIAGLGRAQADADAERVQLRRRQADLRAQAENHRVNLTALRCDLLGGATGIDGTWNLTQGNYSGWLILHQTGAALTGTMSWSNHGEMGSVMKGTFVNRTIRFQIAYPSGDRGEYEGTVDSSGRSMQGSTSGTLGTGPWSATRSNQPER